MRQKLTPSRAVYRALVIAALTGGCTGYIPGRQTYWDNKIQNLCDREGKVRIFEQVVLTKAQAERMPRLEGKLATRARTAGAASDPVYSERKTTHLNDDPQVIRDEVSVIRAADGKVVAQWIEYSRIGGDIPTGIAHPSSFRCPDPKQRLDELQKLFVVAGD